MKHFFLSWNSLSDLNRTRKKKNQTRALYRVVRRVYAYGLHTGTVKKKLHAV